MTGGVRLATSAGACTLTFSAGVVMADKAKLQQPQPREQDPKAPKPEKDDQHLRDTSRPAHPNERERDKNR
jgi:hypothetical protein